MNANFIKWGVIMNELIKKRFSELLRAKRNERDWSQKKAAEMCGRCTRDYEKLENCEILPSMETLVNLILMYDIDMKQFALELVAEGYSADDKSCALT